MDIKAQTRVHIAKRPAKVREVLSEVLGELGLAYKLQGGVIYIVRQKEQVIDN